jgi:hypothetical protein
VWFVELDDTKRINRLISRHVATGKSPEEADAWVRDVDEPNAQRILARRDTADFVVSGE